MKPVSEHCQASLGSGGVVADFGLPVATAPYLLAKALALIEWESCFVEKPLKNGGFGNGSRGRTRTYNPAVNSRMLYH